MQEVHGYIDVSSFKHLLTPVIWTSFITGKEPHEHGVYSWWRFSRYRWLDRLAHWIRYNVPVIKNLSSAKLKRLLRIFGLKPRLPSREDLGVPTMFDLIKPSKALFVPGYSEESWIRDYYSKAFEKGVNEAEKAIWYIHSYRKQKLFSELEKSMDWRLFMVWFDLADWIGHLYMGRSKLKVMKAYFELNRLAAKVKEMIPEDTLFIIVSDHGMEPGGYHSPRAFYSFNKDPGWRPRKITDFFHFIILTLSCVQQCA
jgi:predicted AlkP superfamily pyrophosphatase or phosphodiesterase